jgi:hypothetical protein
MGQTGDGRHIPKALSVSIRALLIVRPKAILIGKLSCYKVFNFRKIKNMTIVLIFVISIYDAKPDGDKLVRNSTV